MLDPVVSSAGYEMKSKFWLKNIVLSSDTINSKLEALAEENRAYLEDRMYQYLPKVYGMYDMNDHVRIPVKKAAGFLRRSLTVKLKKPVTAVMFRCITRSRTLNHGR